jgi:hypothetical protein
MASEFPSNAHGLNQPASSAPKPDKGEKVVRQVVKSKVVRRKKSRMTRFKETFITGDENVGVFEYVFGDVIIPAMKDLIADAVTSGVERRLFGEAGGRRGGYRSARGGGNAAFTAYNRMSGPPSRREDPRAISRRAHANFDFEQIIIPSRVEAEEVLGQMIEIISNYEVASVRDLYGCVGEEASFTDGKWGWFDLRGAKAVRVDGGYLLDLPRPEPLD